MGRSDQEKIIEKDFMGLGGDAASGDANKHVYTGNLICTDASKHMYMNNHMYFTDPHISSQRRTDTLVIMKPKIPADAVQQPTASRWLYSNNHRSSNLDFAAMRSADWSNRTGRQQFLSFNDFQGQRLGEGVNDTYHSRHINQGSTPLDCILAANSSTYQSGSLLSTFPFVAPSLHELAFTNRLQPSPTASYCWPSGQALKPEPSARSHWPAGGTSSRTLPSDSCIKPSSAQLTIFYAGKVNVYNDVSLIKAEEIMLMAAAGNLLPPNTDTSRTKSSSMVRVPRSQINTDPRSQFNTDPQDHMDLHTCQPDLFAKDQSSLPASIPHAPEAQGSKLNIQSVFFEDELVVPRALPLARKASLARFLEKRKERVSKSPYLVEKTFTR